MELAANAAWILRWQVSFDELLRWEPRDVELLKELVDSAAQSQSGSGVG